MHLELVARIKSRRVNLLEDRLLLTAHMTTAAIVTRQTANNPTMEISVMSVPLAAVSTIDMHTRMHLLFWVQPA